MIPRLIRPWAIAASIAAVALSGCSMVNRDARPSGQFVDVPGVGSTRVDVPRPTSMSSAPCAGAPLPDASDASVEARIADLRAIGLFADREGVSNRELGAEVTAALTDTWGGFADVPKEMIDLAIAEQDRSRVWWRDLEADVTNGNDVYEQTLAEWSEISAGAFMPTDVVESWAGDEGPVTVRYRLNDTEQTLSPAYLEDWIDPGILVPINSSIAASGRRFELYKAFDQTAFVMALTERERQALEARGWCFE